MGNVEKYLTGELLDVPATGDDAMNFKCADNSQLTLFIGLMYNLLYMVSKNWFDVN